MAFKSGMAFQDRLKAYLDKQQYDVEQDEILDHEFKIDLAIRRFPQNPKHYSLGLQVTERCDDPQKMRTFYEVHTSGFQVVDRVMYVEVEASDFEHGVGHLVSTAISSFQFDERLVNERLIGVRVLRSMRFEFFNLKERLAKLATEKITSFEEKSKTASPSAEVKSIVQAPAAIDLRQAGAALKERLLNGREDTKQEEKELHGFINGFYRTKGEGFITGQDGFSYYFKLEGVGDGKLRDRLMNLPYFETAVPVEGTVAFRSVGRTRPNAKYEEARGLRMI